MKNLFSTVCYLVLMQNGDGVISKAPLYIQENANILSANDPMISFAHLDLANQQKVLLYCTEWDVEVPKDVLKYYKDVYETLKEHYDL